MLLQLLGVGYGSICTTHEQFEATIYIHPPPRSNRILFEGDLRAAALLRGKQIRDEGLVWHRLKMENRQHMLHPIRVDGHSGNRNR